MGFRDSDVYHLGKHWQDREPDTNDAFTRPDTQEVIIDIDSRGSVDFTFHLKCDCEWLVFSGTEGKVDACKAGGTSIVAVCRRELLKERESALVRLYIAFADGSRYRLIFELVPRNHYYAGCRQKFACCVNDGEIRTVCALGEGYITEEQDREWNSSVTNNSLCFPFPRQTL